MRSLTNLNVCTNPARVHRPLIAARRTHYAPADNHATGGFAGNSPSMGFRGERNALLCKLERFARLSFDEVTAVETLSERPKSLEAEHTLFRDGELPLHVCLIVEGFAYRYKLTADGRRQILGYLLPGDLCDVEFADGNRSDHSVAVLGGALVASITLTRINELRTLHPRIERAFLLASLAERSILREWLTNVGQRSAVEGISHLICEMLARLRAIGRFSPGLPIELPVSQAAMADSIGVTTVHANRSLKLLRKEGLIAIRRQKLTILNPERLARIAGFDQGYLGLDRSPG
ncbi:MAG: Crp/Fnr family transcriptional regulator [Sphingomicrobium sp.]